jgi:hypothetical protein
MTVRAAWKMEGLPGEAQEYCESPWREQMSCFALKRHAFRDALAGLHVGEQTVSLFIFVCRSTFFKHQKFYKGGGR